MKIRTLMLGVAAAALTAACASTAETGTYLSASAAEEAAAPAAEAPAAEVEAAEMPAAEASVMVGGAAMYPSKNIVENAVNSTDHTTLVAALTAAGLVDTLASPGPFTVFAPVNDAFAALPAGTVDTLLLPENKDMLTKVLTAHVVPGDLKASDLMAMAATMGGKAELTTVSGDTLTFWVKDGAAYVTDENGGAAAITIADVDQSNGVIHVVDKVLLPN